MAVPDPAGIHPVGVDRGETNVLVALDADGDQQFVSGLAYTPGASWVKATSYCYPGCQHSSNLLR